MTAATESVPAPPRIALAHDYLTQRGGAERVALQLTRSFPGAVMHTSLYDRDTTFPEFREVDVRTSALQRVPGLRRDPRLAVPLLARAWGSVDVGDVDVVLASSSGWAHGVKAPAGGRKVVYCHNPPRWLHQPAEYLQSGLAAAVMAPLAPSLRRWDRRAADSADAYIANSTSVARRIETAYGRDAAVVFPPVMIDTSADQEPVEGLEPGFWLTVARGRGYKNVDAVSEGVRRHGEGVLAVVGQAGEGRAKAPHEHWCGVVSDAQLRWLYANARALISVSFEDFGLTPLEANAFGTPAVVLRAGGFLDSTDPGTSGWWVEAPTGVAVEDALRTLPLLAEDPIRAHAATFSADAFSIRLRRAVADAMDGGGGGLDR